MLNKEAEDLLLEILTIYGHGRRILGEEIDINHKLAEYFKDVDDAKLLKTKNEVEKDVLDEFRRISL